MAPYRDRTGRLYGVGVGPGDPGLLTFRAAEVFDSVQRIFYVEGAANRESISRSVVANLSESIRNKLRKLVFSMAPNMEARKEVWIRNAGLIVDELTLGKDCAFATIGDPMIYSTFVYVLPFVRERLPNLDLVVVPGITSFQAAAARSAVPLAMNDEILSIIPAWKEELLQRDSVADADATVFLKTYRKRDAVVEWTADRHSGEFLYASRVGLHDETLYDTPEDLHRQPAEYLSLVISRKRNHDGCLD